MAAWHPIGLVTTTRLVAAAAVLLLPGRGVVDFAEIGLALEIATATAAFCVGCGGIESESDSPGPIRSRPCCSELSLTDLRAESKMKLESDN